MPINSILIAESEEFSGSSLPASYGAIEFIKGSTNARSSIRFLGRREVDGNYVMFLTSGSGATPTGTWVNETNSGSFVVEERSSGSQRTNSDGYLDGSFSVSKSGYTPIAIGGISTGTTWVIPTRFYLDGNTFYYGVRAVNSTAGTGFNIYVRIVYIRT